MMKTLTFSVLSALLAFNVGTHLETSKVAKFKLTHYKQCVSDVVDELGYDDFNYTMFAIRDECGQHL